MRNIKQINVKSRSYYFFNNKINTKSFDTNLLNINKILFKSTDDVIYNIRYITMKSLDHVIIDIGNTLYLIFNNQDRHIEENNGDKQLIFAATDKNKGVLTKLRMKLKIKLR